MTGGFRFFVFLEEGLVQAGVTFLAAGTVSPRGAF
jgi:hypothetical protein